MKTSTATTFVLVMGLALTACGSDDKIASTGGVSFDLELPGGQSVGTVTLKLNCPASGVSQSHVLQVTKGAAVASFGGLAPGTCNVTLATQSADGTNCAGSANFTVVANQNVDVLVTLACQGVNKSEDGSITVTTSFKRKPCTQDRIKTVFAIPSNIMLGESTTVEVATNADAIVGTPKFTWRVRNSATQTATGPLTPAVCSAGSASCQSFTCAALGAARSADPRTGFALASASVAVTLEDDDCFDTEEVSVDCLSTTTCGNATAEGIEECDDGNTKDNDGCSSACVVERCGDGIVQTNEACDGLIGVPPAASCAPDCKSVVLLPTCGDGAVNQASEQCDGAAGLKPGQVCGSDCRVVPVCGNGHREAPEVCDDGNQVSGDDCEPDCAVGVLQPACRACIASLPDIGDFNRALCNDNPLCMAARDCVLQARGCWGTIASAACYCGDTQADIDACEQPTFVPKGRCAAELRTGAGTNPTNLQVLQRYFDPEYPAGIATIVLDGAFTSNCKAFCF